MNNTTADIFQVTGSKETQSNYGGKVTQVYFKNLTSGGSFMTWLDPKNANWQRWFDKIKRGTQLKGLRVKENRLIDADSMPVVVVQNDRTEEPKPETPAQTVDRTENKREAVSDRAYVEIDGTWRHIYIIKRFVQSNLFGEAIEMVEFKLSSNTKVTHSIEADQLHESKPAKKRTRQDIA